jgi:membrane-bound lytic murein transglycosylase A
MNKSQTFRHALSPPLALILSLFLAACAALDKAPPAPCPAAPETPRLAEPLRAARWSDLPGWRNDDLTAAWPAFLQSCRGMAGKPYWPAWRAICEEARALSGDDAQAVRSFFESRFTPYRLIRPDGSTQGLITGYYEPLLHGSRMRTEEFGEPVFGVPPDLLTIDLSAVAPDLANQRLRGRLEGHRVLPYWSRAEMTARGWADLHPETILLWVDDPVELFFLQIQGSGRVRLPDGSLVRLGYADHNGHPYQTIGRVLAERGEIPIEQASMQRIKEWARANPSRLGELLDTNPSYVFFREMPEPTPRAPDEGPVGALGVPLTPGRSLAVDRRHVPLGAPVFLSTTAPASMAPLQRLMLAQDTGGAIRGVVRGDFFWGFGAEAGEQAGRMKQPGEMWVLLPDKGKP